MWSDEDPTTDKFEKSAILGRTYANTLAPTPLAGWTLTLNRNYAWKPSMVNKDFAALAADGRTYTVRVCAQDLAGLVGCAEAAVKVPPKGAGTPHKLADPINNGKIYNVADDLVYWNRAQDDIPFRLKNTGLNL